MVNQGRELYKENLKELLKNNNMLMYLTHNEGMTVVAERFTTKLKSIIYQKVAINDSKFYSSYLNRLVDQYNNQSFNTI